MQAPDQKGSPVPVQGLLVHRAQSNYAERSKKAMNILSLSSPRGEKKEESYIWPGVQCVKTSWVLFHMKVRASVVPEVVVYCYAEVPGFEADFHNDV